MRPLALTLDILQQQTIWCEKRRAPSPTAVFSQFVASAAPTVVTTSASRTTPIVAVDARSSLPQSTIFRVDVVGASRGTQAPVALRAALADILRRCILGALSNKSTALTTANVTTASARHD